MKKSVVVYQHIPNWTEGVEIITTDVSSLEKLLEVSFIKKWKESGHFKRFYIKKENYSSLLMAEMRDGNWVVAHLGTTEWEL